MLEAPTYTVTTGVAKESDEWPYNFPSLFIAYTFYFIQTVYVVLLASSISHFSLWRLVILM